MRRVLLVVLVLGGCVDAELRVEADASWHGSINYPEQAIQTVGTGNKAYPLPEGRTCWLFKKNGEHGKIRAYVQKGTAFFVWEPSVYADSISTRPLGQVGGCYMN